MKNRELLAQTFSRAFQRTFQDSDLEFLSYKSESFWDSLGHMTLMAQISSDFKIELSFEEMINLLSFKECLDFLNKYEVDL
jgi:acyl carrier protein